MGEPVISVAELTFRSDDLAQIALWLSEEWGRDSGYSLEETRLWCAELAASETEAVFAGYVGEALVGTALLVDCDLDLEPRLRPWLSGFYILPEFRGRGVGAPLLQAIDAAARKQSHEQLYLYCRADRLIANYESYEWRVIKHFNLHGRRYSLMSKPLT